jgi:hypothetical protein
MLLQPQLIILMHFIVLTQYGIVSRNKTLRWPSAAAEKLINAITVELVVGGSRRGNCGI